MTDAERRLWSNLRARQVLGLQFYRQKPIGSFIVDFYCAAAKLVIEVDGGQHFDDVNAASDRVRDAALAALGLTVLRFDNLQVLKETDAVLSIIHQHVATRIAIQ